jgi:hypothetical protein
LVARREILVMLDTPALPAMVRRIMMMIRHFASVFLLA